MEAIVYLLTAQVFFFYERRKLAKTTCQKIYSDVVSVGKKEGFLSKGSFVNYTHLKNTCCGDGVSLNFFAVMRCLLNIFTVLRCSEPPHVPLFSFVQFVYSVLNVRCHNPDRNTLFRS